MTNAGLPLVRAGRTPVPGPNPGPGNLGRVTDTKTRKDGRSPSELRSISITRNWQVNGEGSVLVEFGRTRVLCVASFVEGVPRWRKGGGEGWVTAEYAMLPRAGSERSGRESVRGKIGGRTHEISRLIGRSLRGVVDVAALGENTITLDCDVLQADGGTRTAAVTGAYVALADAVAWGTRRGYVKARAGKPVIADSVSAVSVGIIDGVPCLDLPYEEDVRAQTDMNVVQTGAGNFIEVQGTAEHAPFDRTELGTLLDLATKGNAELAALQARVLAGPDDVPFTVSTSERAVQSPAGTGPVAGVEEG
ncbi:Ribonuclease PH [Actinomyces succiniciruminis]|uniref:Ribonuclease PH n=1 Tax=Actinomyces succiniciruminis TaxID=1522002 RepID=A0A1L7RC74_9ACTO|nr:Ribonuclease PH [Actinomyces succiniciruminis]